MAEAIRITREQATAIIAGQVGPAKQVVVCAPGSEWYDIRELSDDERINFIQSLLKKHDI